MSNFDAPVDVETLAAHIAVLELNIEVPMGREIPQLLDNGVVNSDESCMGMPRVVNVEELSKIDLNMTTLADGIATILSGLAGHHVANFADFTNYKECVFRIDDVLRDLGWSVLIARTNNDILVRINEAANGLRCSNI